MTDTNENPSADPQDTTAEYDKRAEQNRQNAVEARDAAREGANAVNPLWQSATVGTDGTGPRVEEVTPIFDQARADALAHPVTADASDDGGYVADEVDAEAQADLKGAAEEAQASADEKTAGVKVLDGQAETEKADNARALNQDPASEEQNQANSNSQANEANTEETK